jgi:hypothetical protein
MKKSTNIKYALLLIVLLGFLPVKAFAATVYLEASRTSVSVGDTVIVTAKINAGGTTINTVEGDVTLTSGGANLAVQEFSLANSAFGLWPRTPSLSKDGLTVSFVGGVPGGFNIEGATLFNIIYQVKKVGTVAIAPESIVVYANDGKGTKLPVQTKGLTLNISPAKAGSAPVSDWGSVVALDTTPPEPFIIVLGQDPSIYNGQKFAYFSAVDNQSGIAYYDVSENGAPAARSGSTYVLQDQSGNVKLAVTAYDKAGNKRTATYPAMPAASTGSTVPSGSVGSWFAGISWLTVIIVVLIIVIAWVLYRKLRRKSKNDASAPQ